MPTRERPRSPATQPGYNRGRPPGNKGKVLPKDVLTPDEYSVLLAAFSKTSATGRRNRAMVSLMYRTGMKVGQIVKMERHHYRRGTKRVIVPATARQEERRVGIPSETRGELARWLDARDEFEFGPTAPLFCTTLGTAVYPAYVRTILPRESERSGITKTVTPETLRRSYLYEQATERPARIQGLIESYIDTPAFRERYPAAYEAWTDAFDSYMEDPELYATKIGHDCREAMFNFSTELANHHGVEIPKLGAGTVQRLRAVIAARRDDMPAGPRELLEAVAGHWDAVLNYWGTVSDMAQRQEHGAAKERQALTSADARQVVFHTMAVMYEATRMLDATR